MSNLGFEFEGYSKGGFMNYWIDKGIVKHRQPMQHKWVMEQMGEGKCIAVPNAGVKKYTLICECRGESIKEKKLKDLFQTGGQNE